MPFPGTFYLHIYFKDGSKSQHPFHFGTQESVARKLTVDKWKSASSIGITFLKFELMFDRKVFDTLTDRGWASHHSPKT